MEIIKNVIVAGSDNRPMATDIFFEPTGVAKPVIVYAHGFNGFKDWGNFDIIAKRFAAAGFIFIKFNFSHNGTTPEQPEEFADLEAYGNNNYTKELFDLGAIIDWSTSSSNDFAAEIDREQIFLLGHSLGGGIVILKAAEDRRVKKIVTWASISECQTPWTNWTEERIAAWKASGVEYTMNSRTKQQLPLYYQLHEDYHANADRLDIKKAIRNLNIPILLCHGTNDEAVPVQKAGELNDAQPSAELFIIRGGDHVFGRKHPWNSDELPEAMEKVLVKSIAFFKKHVYWRMS